MLCGNPGTGKTCFGFYAMHRLMREDRSFIYEPTKSNGLNWVFHSSNTRADGVPQLECLEQRRLEKYYHMSHHIVHIVDGHAPPEVLYYRTVLICSPRKMHFHEFRKHPRGCDNRYMPAWSYIEIESCRSQLFDKLPKDLVNELFNRWGGIARNVLNIPQMMLGISIYLIWKSFFFYLFVFLF
jgi:hypothetical protein